MKLDITNDNKINKKWILTLFALYMIALIWVIIFKCNNVESLHISTNKAMTIRERLLFKAVPFQYTFYAVFVEGGLLESIALIFNVVCFLPAGLLLRCFFKRRYVMLIGTGTSFCFEVFQLFSAWGGPDISDIILNAIGVLFGILLYDLLIKRIESKVVNLLALIFIVVAIPLDVYAIVNSVIHFPGF